MFNNEKILQLLQYNMSGLTRSFPEVRGLAVTILWDSKLGANLPPGLFMAANDQMTADTALGLVRQNSELMANMLLMAGTHAAELTKKLQAQEEKIRELEEKLRPVAGQISYKAEAAGPFNHGESSGPVERLQDQS